MLRFDRAVHHEVKSVRIYYVTLVLAIVRLLATDTDQVPDDALCEIVSGAIGSAFEHLSADTHRTTNN